MEGNFVLQQLKANKSVSLLKVSEEAKKKFRNDRCHT